MNSLLSVTHPSGASYIAASFSAKRCYLRETTTELLCRLCVVSYGMVRRCDRLWYVSVGFWWPAYFVPTLIYDPRIYVCITTYHAAAIHRTSLKNHTKKLINTNRHTITQIWYKSKERGYLFFLNHSFSLFLFFALTFGVHSGSQASFPAPKTVYTSCAIL